ncbi:MAG: outer membrane beta-barrel protein [Saprospiraceae bacterium]
MKKFITLVILALITVTRINAQDFRLGIQTSPTFSWMTSNQNTITGDGVNLGLEVGLLGDYYFNDKYAISSGISLLLNQGGGLAYSTGGNLFPDSELSNVTLDSIANGSQVDFSFQYVEIPFSVKLRGGTGDLGYYVQIPYFSLAFPIQGRADIATYEDENIRSSVFPLALTWGLGAGAEYQINDLTVTGGLSYQNSILDIIKNNGTLNTGEKEDAKQIMNRITLRVGIFF